MSIISDNQLYDYCIEVAKCPAFLNELQPYAKQALKHYATEQQTRKFFSDGERAYYRAMMPVYAAADVVLALLDTPTLTPSEGKKPTTSDAPAKPTPPADLWAGLLINDYTVTDLDRLLYGLGLLEDLDSLTPTPEAKGAVWLGIAEGLRIRKRMKPNYAKLYRALVARYGDDIGGISNIQHGFKAGSTKAESWRDTVTARVAKL